MCGIGCQIKLLVVILLLNLKISLIKQIIIMNSYFIGYLLNIVTLYCRRCLCFREQTECFDNFADLFDVPRSSIYWKNLKIFYLNIFCFLLN